MFEAFRVGPVRTRQGDAFLYAACGDDGAVSAIGEDDRAGLTALRDRAPRGMVTCEPALAAAGQPLGYRPAALSDTAKQARATFAGMLLYGPGVSPRAVSQLPQLIEVAQRFHRERAWQLVRPEVPIEIVLERNGREARFAASVLGADGVEHGIALHASAAALERFVDLVERNRRKELLRLPVRSVTIDSEPAWVADAVEAAYGDPIVVVPIAIGTKGPREVTCDDLTELAAAMFAISKLGPGRLSAQATLEADDGGVCRATARIPGGATVAAPPLPDWATRPMSLSGEVPAALATIPVLPVSDLTAAVAGLRALGFEVTETSPPRVAAAAWPGLLIEVIEAPSARGGSCHIAVESIDALDAIWSAARIEFRRIESSDDSVLVVEVPGDLTLTFGASLPPGYRAAAKRCKPRRARVRSA